MAPPKFDGILYVQEVVPGSTPFYIVGYYMKLVTTSLTDGTNVSIHYTRI